MFQPPMNRPPAYYSPSTPPPTQQTHSGYVPPPPVPQPTSVRSEFPQPPPQHTRQYHHQAGKQHYTPPHRLHQQDEGAIHQNFAQRGQSSMAQITTRSQLTICNHQQFIKNRLRELR